MLVQAIARCAGTTGEKASAPETARAPAAPAAVAKKARAVTQTRIETEERFREFVVGKRKADKRGWAARNADGTHAGEFDGKNLAGTWAWEDGYCFREGTCGGEKFPYNHQVALIKGGQTT